MVWGSLAQSSSNPLQQCETAWVGMFVALFCEGRIVTVFLMPSRRRNWQQADSTEWVKILRGRRPPSVHRVRWNVQARASERSLKDHQGGRVVSRACRERRFQHSPSGGSSQGSWHATSPSPRGTGGWAGPFGVWRHCAPRARPVSGCIHTPCLEEGQIRELISPACSRWSTSCKRSEVRSR